MSDYTSLPDQLPKFEVGKRSDPSRTRVVLPQHGYLVDLKGSPARSQVGSRRMPNLGTIDEFVCNSKGEHNDDADVILEEMLCRRVLGTL